MTAPTTAPKISSAEDIVRAAMAVDHHGRLPYDHRPVGERGAVSPMTVPTPATLRVVGGMRLDDHHPLVVGVAIAVRECGRGGK